MDNKELVLVCTSQSVDSSYQTCESLFFQSRRTYGYLDDFLWDMEETWKAHKMKICVYKYMYFPLKKKEEKKPRMRRYSTYYFHRANKPVQSGLCMCVFLRITILLLLFFQHY